MVCNFPNYLVLCQVLIAFNYITSVEAQDNKLIISLNTSFVHTELYGDFYNINPNSTVEVNIENTNKKLSFVIFQVHSHMYNITLYKDILARNSSISGTNLGLHSPVYPKISTFFIYNPNVIDLRVYISVHGYGAKDPIPGGCNMEFPVSTSPFLEVQYTSDYVTVDTAAAQAYGDNACLNNTLLTYAYYRLYLPVRDFSADTYFDGIKRMIILEGIEKNGDKISPYSEDFLFWPLRRIFGNYPGTASIYAVVVRDLKNNVAVYVPSHTYGCSLTDKDDSCALLDDSISQILCAMLLFTGIFICYLGHRFFKTEMFLMGLTSGIIVTYILISAITDMDRSPLLGACLMSGIFFGAIWWLFWWFYSIPLYAMLIPSLNTGFLLTCVIFYVLGNGNFIFISDYNYWMIFVAVLLAISLGFISVTYSANLLCCAILGSFAIIYPMDYYIGSNLKYLIVNIIRRATVDKFNKAILSPPYQWNEALLTVSWIALCLTGYLTQHYLNRNKPPFPPPPRSSRPVPTDLGPPSYGTVNPVSWYRRLGRRRVNTGRRQSLIRNDENAPLLA